MRRLVSRSLCLLFLAVFSATSSLGSAKAEPAPRIDLSKTRELYQSWIQRKSFPDSATFAYYYAYALKALDGEIAPEVKDRLVAFVKRCQRDDGGFVSNPKYGAKSNIIYSYHALAALRLLGADGAIDRDKAYGFVQGLIRPDGSIGAASGKAGANLASTYYGVESLGMLGKLDTVDRDKTAAFVLRHRNPDGGFGVTPEGANSPRGVSMAAQTLATLDRLSGEVQTGAVSYMENAIGLLGTRGPKFRALSTLQAAEDIVAALDQMGVLPEVITEPLLKFVNARYIPENGGFGPAPGLGTAPPSTYQGIYCLTKLGKLTGEAKPAPATAN